jgi:hypothetical protein
MDMILLTKGRHEIDLVRDLDADFEVGVNDSAGADTNPEQKTVNTFEISTRQLDAGGIYCPGTEFGGLIEHWTASADSDTVTYKGWTWRGLLENVVLVPPAGSDYLVVSGEANTIIRSLLADVLGGFFYVPSKDSGLTVKSYQFNLYCTALDGLEAMLESYGYRLSIHADKTSAGQPIRVTVEAVKAVTIAGTFNADSDVRLTFTANAMGINHLICLGKGELQARTRVDLYMDGSGGISTKQTMKGFAERQAVYDYSSAESKDDLISGGTERLKKLASATELSIASVQQGRTLEIGDLVTGYLNGLSVTAPITGKICKIQDGVASITYSVKGEN